jgi:hypothetical protein
MKVYLVFVACAAGATAVAGCTKEAVQPSGDCATLLAQYDQAAPAASVEQVSTAAAAREEGYDLCLDGRSADGSAKLIEAISQISAGVQGATNSRK